MQMRWIFGLAASVAITAALVGCGSSSSGEASKSGTTTGSTQPGKTEGGDFKVALLTLGKTSDSGWNAMALDGLNAIKSDMGATVDTQIASPQAAKDAMRSYAQKGYQLVFGHGYEYNEPGFDVSKDFPNTVFISSSGGKTTANAGAFRFYLEQGCYLAGMMAGKMSKTGKVGAVAVLDIPSINSTIDAFYAGAKAANPNIVTLPTVYFGGEGDIAGAKRATESLIGKGADFIIHQANDAAQGVFDACATSEVNAIGTNADQNSNPSGAVVGSAVIIAKPAFLELAKQVKDKTYKGQVTLVGADKGAIDFVPNPSYSIPDDVKKLIDDTRAKIKSGELAVPKKEF